MKKILYFLTFCLILGACYVLRLPDQDGAVQPVNPILGDKSFRHTFGRLPNAADPEELRIKTHLAFVEQELRKVAPADLVVTVRQNRGHLLNLLKDYREAGRFPSNYGYPNERKPCFIDRDGAICAVGYLIEQTSGRALAEKINIMHQYDYIHDMDMPELDEWIAQSGFSAEEFAMIQPTYYQPGPDEYIARNHVATGYAIASGSLAGLNGTAGFYNLRNILTGTGNNFTGILGIAGGAASVTLGITQMNKGKGEYIGTKFNGQFPDASQSPLIGQGIATNVYTKNPANAAVSWANITTGAASIALGALNLFSKNKPGKSCRCPSFSVAPLPGSGAVVGFSGKF